jgi:hypothetical protein
VQWLLVHVLAPTRKEFNAQNNTEYRAGLKALVDAGQALGLLAYADGASIAWCSIAPREIHAALECSRVLARVARPYRRSGLMEALVHAATGYTLERRAAGVEAYPTELGGRSLSGSAGYMGAAATFARAGYLEVARRPNGRLIMRYAKEDHHV